ncbi:hypothetical protein [Flectobacillus major]|uniref:hypothetical protein n=1 Tax=Flectobacillus major TaxID=103 RepID=UPI00041F8E50|nr:hypothetical protein [Flectobacillus major]
MNNNATSIETLCEKAEDYTKTTIALFRLRTIAKSADIVSSLAVQLLLAIVVAMVVLMLTVGVAFWLGEALGKIYYGFFVVAGVYAVGAIILYILRRQWIKVPISNIVIENMLK